MKTYIKIPGVLLGFACLAALTAQANPLVVTTSNSATTLTNSILGAGITLSGAPTYSGANTGASGTFTGGGDLIGISTGLIMTTGNAAGAPGPNNSTGYTGAGTTSTLEFDFTTAGGDLFFNYVFASEEYNEYVFSAYNDKFFFYLDGVNIAKIPSTSTDVTIDTVNLSVNSAYYNNNTSGAVNIQYDGFTDVFTAKALGLAAGTHHIKLTIFDVGDSSLDSAVFIQGNSFSDTQTPPGVPDAATTLGLLGASLSGLALLRRQIRR